MDAETTRLPWLVFALVGLAIVVALFAWAGRPLDPFKTDCRQGSRRPSSVVDDMLWAIERCDRSRDELARLDRQIADELDVVRWRHSRTSWVLDHLRELRVKAAARCSP